MEKEEFYNKIEELCKQYAEEHAKDDDTRVIINLQYVRSDFGVFRDDVYVPDTTFYGSMTQEKDPDPSDVYHYNDYYEVSREEHGQWSGYGFN